MLKPKIQSIVSAFETGSASPRYYKLVVMRDGSGGTLQVTYGKHQTTEQSNLAELVADYVNAPNALFASGLRPYLSKIGRTPLWNDATFKSLLIDAGMNDPVMQQVQDHFFDVRYWDPAELFFNANHFSEELSMLVIYDSYIHSGSVPSFLRRRFSERTPQSGGHEHKWIDNYVDVRHQWLATHPNPLLQKCVYRTQCFKNQIAANNWNLSKPVNANGIIIQ